MKHRLVTYVAALTVSGLGLTAGAQSGQSNAPQPPAQEQQQSPSQQSGPTGRQLQEQEQQQAPQGYVLIEERTIYLMANEPQQHFLQAHAKLAQKDYRAAAEETRLAAAYLDMQAARTRNSSSNNNNGQNSGQSSGQVQQSLSQQADQLRQLAGQIQQGGQNVSTKQLDQKFAEASQALAKHFDSLTKSELQQRNYVAAGYDLDATASSFKNTIIWSDQKPSEQDVAMIQNAQRVAANLQSNDVYAGQQALNQQQGGQNQGANQQSASAGQQPQAEQQPGIEQQASAHEPGITHNPLTGTTPAEARNDAQHAQKLASALGQAIDRFSISNNNNRPGQSQGSNGSISNSSSNSGSNPGSQTGNPSQGGENR